MVVWDDENVAHALSRAGFGGTLIDVAKYRNYGQALAVEKLIGVSASNVRGPSSDSTDFLKVQKLKKWWVKRLVKASTRRVQEKMVLFWHDHFASTMNNSRILATQNQTFRVYGLGSFKTLVTQITRDPLMLVYLNGLQNTVVKPNENYARELMELFTLGVRDLNGVPNYTQADVREMARALTGYKIVSLVSVMDPTRFDAGTKTVFAGTSFEATGNLGVEDPNGTPFPPARNVIDILCTHRDSDGALTMPRFITKKLWEYLAYPDPSKALIDALAAPFIAGGFVVRDILRAILLHDEFYSEAAKTSSVKNPCEFAFSAIRAVGAKTDASTLPQLLADMGMDLFEPPSVNGWNGGLAWLSTGQFLTRVRFGQILASNESKALTFTPSRVYDTTATSAPPIVAGLLLRLGVASRVPASVRAELETYVAEGNDFTNPAVTDAKVRGVVAFVLALPETHIH